MKKIVTGIILVYVCTYLIPLGGRPLATPDEMRYGEIAHEMLKSGDWTVPHLMEFRYFEKPVLGHWLNACSMQVFGSTRFGIRFASAAAVGLAAFSLFLLMRKERDEEMGILAAFIFITCVEVQMIGTFSTLDSMVSAFITLSLCSFYPALSAQGMKRAGWLLLVGVFAGCAFLVKGFLAIAIPVMVIGPFLFMQKRWKDVLIFPWLPLIGILLVSLPWSISVALREGDFWNYFFFEEHIHRFFGKQEAQHAEPFWYFIPVLLAGALPWTFLAPAPLYKLIKQQWKEPFIRFAVTWAALPFLFFSASSGKLGTYILPCFPPLAILLAIGLKDRMQQESDKTLRVVAGGFLGIFVSGFIGLGLTAVLPIEAIKLYQPFEAYKYAIALTGIAVSGAFAYFALRHKVRAVNMICLGLAVATGVGFFQFCIPESRSVSVSMDAFLNRQKSHMPDDAIVIADIRTLCGVGLILGRPDVYMVGDQGEMDYGIAYPDSAHRFIGFNPADLLPFFRAHSDRPIVVVSRQERIDEVLSQLPEPVYKDEFRYLRFYVFAPETQKEI